MKIINNCTLLAAALSAKYRTYSDFQPSVASNTSASNTLTASGSHGPAAAAAASSSFSSLEEFLDENGIVVTMCMRFHGLVPSDWECSQPQSANGKVSASWIQANKTAGFRVVKPPVDVGPPVGFILKPTAFSIPCVYPMDADTDRRDDHGCGPLSRDARYGSKGYDHETSWYRKSSIRFQIESYKTQEFGTNRTWSSITCADFCQPINGHDVSTMAHVISHNDSNNNSNGDVSWEYLSGSEYLLDQWSHTMRHDVCNTSVPVDPATFDKTQTFIYMGPNSWQPKEWNQMIALMEDAIRKHPLVGTWNELVLQVPSTPSSSRKNETNKMKRRTRTNGRRLSTSKTPLRPEMVQAVFYIQTGDTNHDQAARRIAQKQAQDYQKPLIYVVSMDQSNHNSTLPHEKNTTGDIFHCDEPTVSPLSVSSSRRSNVREAVKDD